MSDEAYLRDLESAARAVGAIPNDYADLRTLLAALPDPTSPDIRSGRTAPTSSDGSLQSGLSTAGLSLTSPIPIGSTSIADLSGPQQNQGGTVFPATPADGDQFLRTDLGLLFAWDAAKTKWLSTQIFTVALGSGTADTSYPATTNNLAWAPVQLQGGADAWLLTATFVAWVVAGSSALSASHSWTMTIDKARDSTTTLTTIATCVLNSGSNGARAVTANIGALLNNGTIHRSFRSNLTKVGTPGAVYAAGAIEYKVVAT